ncbi:MAG: hypothetical protein D6720_11635 [Gammaproteobacteria bacterium]|nr:MAG: hypothetical protein D6720_11635 [Gammaproteobacteria bacterium]
MVKNEGADLFLHIGARPAIKGRSEKFRPSAAQGRVAKIDRYKRLILKHVANRVCGAAYPDKAREGFYQGFPKGPLGFKVLYEVLERGTTEQMLRAMLSDARMVEFEENGEVDSSFDDQRQTGVAL